MSTRTRPLRRIAIAGFTSVLLILSLAACAQNETAAPHAATATTAASSPDEIIATINDRPVSRKLYEMFLRNGREALGVSEETAEGRLKLEELREGIVSELIDRALIAGEAERRGLTATPERLSRIEQREITKLGGERQFAEYLQRPRAERADRQADG